MTTTARIRRRAILRHVTQMVGASFLTVLACSAAARVQRGRAQTRLWSVHFAALVLLLVLIPQTGSGFGTPRLVRDIYLGADPTATSDPSDFVQLGGFVLFTADDGRHGREIWRTDGTADGTLVVKDIAAGSTSSVYSGYPTFTKFKEVVLFVAFDDAHGGELWRSDGTADGTYLVKDINPGTANSGPSYIFNAGSAVYFSADDGSSGAEFWKTDGTESGTVRVADINPGPNSSSPYYFTPAGDVLYFVANDGTHGCELWRTDGTAGGTMLVKDSNPSDQCSVSIGPFGMFRIYLTPQSLTDVGGTLYFATASQFGGELWKSDGTETGTVLLSSFLGCNEFEAVSCPPSCLTNVNGLLYFQAEVYDTGREPWVSNGTAAGTLMLKDINPNRCTMSSTGFDDCSSNACGFQESNGRVRFTARDGTYNYGTWVTDGTPDGTVRAPDLDPTPVPTPPPPETHPLPGRSAMLNGSVIFGLGELYKSDGTEGGTVLLKDINLTPASSYPTWLTNVAGTLLFFANDGERGSELWRSDGTPDGTVLLKDINPGAASSFDFFNARNRTTLGRVALFAADDGIHGTELWRSDGTPSGTSIVKDIDPGSDGGLSVPYYAPPPLFVTANGKLYLSASDAQHGTELWQSDGTDSGTVLLKDINRGAASSWPGGLTGVNRTLFFTANDGIYFPELLKSDGTTAGTVMVGTLGSPYDLIDFQGALYFFAGEIGTGGWALWKSDGTGPGTVQVKGGFPGTPAPQSLVNASGTLFFVGGDSLYGGGKELWGSDGTADGTVLLKRVAPPNGAYIELIAPVERILLFIVAYYDADSRNGRELWSSDGTVGGTVLLKRLSSTYQGPLSVAVAVLGGRLLFFASNSATAMQLWESDGTEIGTIAFDLAPLSLNLNSVPTVVGRELYFAADDGTSGTELWALPLTEETLRCAGDCDGNGTVTVDELVRGVDIALESLGIDRCSALDLNRDLNVSIDELIEAVHVSLRGCR